MTRTPVPTLGVLCSEGIDVLRVRGGNLKSVPDQFLVWPGTPEKPVYYVQDINAAVAKHIEDVVDAQGIFHLSDDKTGEQLLPMFVQVHDPVRQRTTHCLPMTNRPAIMPGADPHCLAADS